MYPAKRKYLQRSLLLSVAFIALPLTAYGATIIPGAADINRVPTMPQQEIRDEPLTEGMITNKAQPNQKIPANAGAIHLTLKAINIQGMKAYTPEQIKPLYESLIGKDVTLDAVWDVATKITKKYRDDGYFLSRAFVPAQEVSNGTITIRVIEGYIGEVEFDKPKLAKSKPMQALVKEIKRGRPTKFVDLERQHLLLTDMPGFENYHGTLLGIDGANDGAVKLLLSRREVKSPHAFFSFDNYGSRYIGPYGAYAGWHGEIIPGQQTSITAAVKAPVSELQAINVAHSIPLTPRLSVGLAGGYTHSKPGDILAAQEMESRAVNGALSLNYQWIRQRRENLKIGAMFDARNTTTDVLGTELNTDHIRAARLRADYDLTDEFLGYNAISATLSHGLNILGASDKNDPNISRAGAQPDFTKLELSYKRLQRITPEWNGLLSLSGQKASRSLYSSEEFGYGGQDFGRAYDQSEITGDDGAAASLELRYLDLPQWENISTTPYGFYDIGKVWNRGDSQSDISASSAGFGVRVSHDSGLSGALQLAFPLTKDVDKPIYDDSNSKNPRIGVQLGYSF